MPIGYDTFATRRHLPHLEREGATYFVTFSSIHRRELPPRARDIALDCCLHDHLETYCLECAVVMPDHLHMVFTIYPEWKLPEVMKRVKGNSSYLINRLLNRRGSFWVEESFDRITRAHEDLRKKCEYVCNNPVRAGLVDSLDDYPWVWRLWIEGGQTGLSVLQA